MQKIAIGIVAVLILVLLGIFVWPKFFGTEKAVYCTLDAKLCPDGSYVGRVPPSCEFAACPGENNSSWKTFKDPSQGVIFQYPETLSAEFVSTQEWPPTVTVGSGNFSCQEGEFKKRRTVDDRTYCVESNTGAAAGSAYVEYAYTATKDGKLVTLRFILRYPNCGNYDEAIMQKCERERESFDLDSIVDLMFQSLQLDIP